MSLHTYWASSFEEKLDRDVLFSEYGSDGIDYRNDTPFGKGFSLFTRWNGDNKLNILTGENLGDTFTVSTWIKCGGGNSYNFLGKLFYVYTSDGGYVVVHINRHSHASGSFRIKIFENSIDWNHPAAEELIEDNLYSWNYFAFSIEKVDTTTQVIKVYINGNKVLEHQLSSVRQFEDYLWIRSNECDTWFDHFVIYSGTFVGQLFVANVVPSSDITAIPVAGANNNHEALAFPYDGDNSYIYTTDAVLSGVYGLTLDDSNIPSEPEFEFKKVESVVVAAVSKEPTAEGKTIGLGMADSSGNNPVINDNISIKPSYKQYGASFDTNPIDGNEWNTVDDVENLTVVVKHNAV